MSARSVLVEKETIEHGAFGGFAAKGGGSQFSNEKLFNGPSWFTEKTQNLY